MKMQTHNDSIDELLKDIIKKEIDAIDEKFTEAIDQIKQQDELNRGMSSTKEQLRDDIKIAKKYL